MLSLLKIFLNILKLIKIYHKFKYTKYPKIIVICLIAIHLNYFLSYYIIYLNFLPTFYFNESTNNCHTHPGHQNCNIEFQSRQ